MDPLDTRFEKLENATRTGYLIGCFIAGTLSIEEREELDAWIRESETNMELFEDMTEDAMVDRFMQWLATRDTESKLQATKQRLKFKKKAIVLKWWHYAAAACIILFIGLFVFRTQDDKIEKSTIAETKAEDIQPGSSMAELRLPGGKVIKLDGLKDSIVGGIKINDGQIVYDNNAPDTKLHEVIIPRKGFYELVLPDSTKVYLNNESSIIYPASFRGDTREVTVTGETFFEVAKDPSKPFIVSIADTKVQAIGTAFNINGFDKAVTLIEGVVRINDAITMNAGQQFREGKITKADIDPVIAWTKGQFRFRNMTMKDIAAKLERWYDCRIIFEDTIGYHLNGTIDRSVPVSRVLQLLQPTGHFQFTINDKVITIRK
ncbi:MAG: FecR domain-containing protein [Chitinophagaceae bacterium]